MNPDLQQAEKNAISEIALTDLFHSKRLRTDQMTGLHWLLLILYFPIGCVLSILRFTLAFIFSLITPKNYRYFILRIIGGFFCSYKQSIRLPQHGAFIASNHSNYLDPIVINAINERPLHLGVVIWHGVNIFSKVICHPTLTVLDKGKNAQFMAQLTSHMQQQNMIVFPEGAVTDSKKGLLTFQPSIFHLNYPIHLIGIKYKRPFSFLSGKAMSKNMGLEVLVDLFQPWTRVELINCGEIKNEIDKNSNSNLATQKTAAQAQHTIAQALGLEATGYSKSDRHRYMFLRDK